jgi:hypothetical protein
MNKQTQNPIIPQKGPACSLPGLCQVLAEKRPCSSPGYDLLFKIRPVIDTLITKFQDVYTPEEQMTIDEAVCPF